MDQELEKRYGLPTAICMVVGIVIGSGVFFKAEAVLEATGGNMALGVAAWLIVGGIMIACAYVFATISQFHGQAGGLVDFAEAAMGPVYAYALGWFAATIYVPGLVSMLAWVAARYTCVLIGWDITGGSCMVMAGFFLCGSYVLNTLSPRLAGRVQVSTTAAKMVPLVLMGLVGTAVGFAGGQLKENFFSASAAPAESSGLMASVVAVAFAYEGWILATSISGELKDADRNLPRALIGGALIVVATYLLYFIGLGGAVSIEELMDGGEAAAKLAFTRMFGPIAGSAVFLLVVVSCLGSLNGLMLACCRTGYALGHRGWGPRPDLFGRADPVTHMPSNSSVMALFWSSFWLLFFYGVNLAEPRWLGPFGFDSSELPVVTLYAMYIPIFLQLMRQGKGLGLFRRFVAPAAAVAGCAFMVFAAFAAHGLRVFHYLSVFAVIMVFGWLTRGKLKN